MEGGKKEERKGEDGEKNIANGAAATQGDRVRRLRARLCISNIQRYCSEVHCGNLHVLFLKNLVISLLARNKGFLF